MESDTKRPAQCPFEVDSFQPAETALTSPDDALPAGRATLRKTFSGGDLEATSTVEMLSAGTGEEAGSYLALERIEGVLVGLHGKGKVEHGLLELDYELSG